MANHRCLSRSVMCSDAFRLLPLGAQAVYAQIIVEADDRGFYNAPYSLARAVGATPEDVQTLIDKRFLLAFDSGVVCDKHWNINNSINEKRRTETKYLDELSTLAVKENGSYTELKDGLVPACIQTANNLHTTCKQSADNLYANDMPKLSKDKLSKESESCNNLSLGTRSDQKSLAGLAPSLSEVKSFFKAEKLNGNPELFFTYYDSVGWVDGNGQPIANWKSLAKKWSIREKELGGTSEQNLSESDLENELAEIGAKLEVLKDVGDATGTTMSGKQYEKFQLETRRKLLLARLS